PPPAPNTRPPRPTRPPDSGPHDVAARAAARPTQPVAPATNVHSPGGLPDTAGSPAGTRAIPAHPLKPCDGGLGRRLPPVPRVAGQRRASKAASSRPRGSLGNSGWPVVAADLHR